MNINSAFPSKYLKAADVETTSPTVTIDRVEMEEVGQGNEKKTKPIVYFVGAKKAMVLNKSNANMIAKIAGTPDTDEWSGVKICLVSLEVEFQGQPTQAIRVRDPRQGKPAARPEPPVEAPDEDSIPF